MKLHKLIEIECLVPRVVLILLRIATKLSMTKSEYMLENYHMKEKFLKSTDVLGSYLLASTSHAAKVGSMASAS